MPSSDANERISPFYTLGQLCITNQRGKNGLLLSNFPVPDDVKQNLVWLCMTIIEPIQFGEFFGKRVIVNSGYRCPAVNTAVGSHPGSQHLLGEAADIHVEGVPHVEVADWIAAQPDILFGQLILENYRNGLGPGTGWVHVSLSRLGSKTKRALSGDKRILMRGSSTYLHVNGTFAEALTKHSVTGKQFTHPAVIRHKRH
jgi:zinc D-Ala-D-Ala carboxypeptidase